jgi:hypothetical protein
MSAGTGKKRTTTHPSLLSPLLNINTHARLIQ